MTKRIIEESRKLARNEPTTKKKNESEKGARESEATLAATNGSRAISGEQGII